MEGLSKMPIPLAQWQLCQRQSKNLPDGGVKVGHCGGQQKAVTGSVKVVQFKVFLFLAGGLGDFHSGDLFTCAARALSRRCLATLRLSVSRER